MSAYSDLVLSHGAVAYWRLNEPSGTTAADSAGTRTGTLAGTGTVLGVTGRLAGELAASFDGNGRILPSSMPSLGSAFTLEAWVKPTTSPGAEPWGILVRSVVLDGDFQWTYRATTVVRLNYYSTTSSNYETLVVLPIGSWTHLTVSGGAGQFVLYVNGVAQPGQAVTLSGTGQGPGAIGGFAEAGAETWGWRGSVQDVAMYPTALSPAQILNHYTVGSSAVVAVPSAGCDHTTVWSKHLSPLIAPTGESERAYLSSLYGEPGGSDMSTLVSRYLQEISCGTAVVTPAAPTLSTVAPNTGTQGTMVTVTLTGTGFIAGATGVSVNGIGISVVNIHVLSPTSLTADLAIAADAPPTARSITVATAGGSSSQAFTVAAPVSVSLLARVQSWPRLVSAVSASLVYRCSPRPTLGNGLIVFIHVYRGAPSTQVISTVVDTNSNTYLLAGAAHANSTILHQIYYCPRLTSVALGSFFDLTITADGSVYYAVQVVEVSGVGAGLVIDQHTGATGTSTAPATGATAALTAATVFQAASHAVGAAQSSITIAVQSPVWTEEFEELPFTFVAGEADTRLVPAAAGTTPSVGWTTTLSGLWAAGLVAFKDS
jgi:hypothetical protein